MSWSARIFFGLAGLVLVVAIWAPPGMPTPKEAPAFREDWPAPDEDSIEYLKGINLRTLQTHDPGEPVPEKVDLIGDPLPPGASVRMVFGWGVSRLALSADGRRIATAG